METSGKIKNDNMSDQDFYKFQFVGGIGNLHGRDEFLPYWRKIRLQ